MKSSTLRQIAKLQDLEHEELKALWRTLNGTEPPAFNRPYILKRLAYRLQELAYGGLPQATRNRLEDILQDEGYDTIGANIRRAQRSNRMKKEMPVTGTQYIREWNGERHVVTAAADGFEYCGKLYRSLTAVASEITGTHWNGPMFFGVKNRSAA